MGSGSHQQWLLCALAGFSVSDWNHDYSTAFQTCVLLLCMKFTFVLKLPVFPFMLLMGWQNSLKYKRSVLTFAMKPFENVRKICSCECLNVLWSFDLWLWVPSACPLYKDQKLTKHAKETSQFEKKPSSFPKRKDDSSSSYPLCSFRLIAVWISALKMMMMGS